MNTYVPKVGEKVKATLGESVIVGLVDHVDPDFVGIVPDGVDRLRPNAVHPEDGWQFEQVVSVPTKFGAVIRRADGVIFLLAEPNSADDTDWFGAGCGWHRRSKATAGGFTVLFEGVDE